MKKFFCCCIVFFACFSPWKSYSQDISGAVDNYIREEFMPAKKYRWMWTKAPVLRAMIVQYEQSSGDEKKIYLDYVRTAMDKKMGRANGHSPNAVASAVGMAFLARVTGEEKYKKAALKVFEDYMKTRRTGDGAVSHKARFVELWDDTIYMVGEFLLEMYRWTGDEKYLNELALQVRIHRKYLLNETTGLWVHGYDADDKKRCNFCGQTGWSKNPEKRSSEMWGRGNGWVVVTLSDALRIIPNGNTIHNEFSGYLKEMISGLPALQDSVTGHWYQLPVRKNEPGNFIESSATIMFAYGILTAVKFNLVSEEQYEPAVLKAWQGLQQYSFVKVSDQYTSLKNVCKGTCIGDKDYYFNRGTKSDSPYGLGLLLQLSLEME